MQLLIGRSDVEINARDNECGQTPLFVAVVNGHDAVVRLLVERDGVDINVKDNVGRTPLSWAVQYGHEAVVRLLSDRG